MSHAFGRLHWVIYVIVFLASFSTFCLNPLKSEYIFDKVARSYNVTNKEDTTCSSNTSTAVDNLINKEASRWTLLFDLTMFLPASVACFLVTSWSDRVGRKVAMVIPLSGMTSSGVILAVMVKMNLSLSWMFLYNVIAGSGGYYMALLMQGNTYLSDITMPEERGFRFAVLGASMGVGGGVASLVGGYWVSARGYFEPVVCTVAMGTACLLLLLVLPSSEKMKRKRNKNYKDGNTACCDDDIRHEASSLCGSRKSSYGSLAGSHEEHDVPIDAGRHKTEELKRSDLLRSVWRIYSSDYSYCETCHGVDKATMMSQRQAATSDRCPHGGGVHPGRVWRLWLYLAIYNFFMFITIGGMTFLILFLLSTPLCFSTVLVGLLLGLKFLATMLVPLAVLFYQKVLHLSNDVIILLSLIGQACSYVIMSLAYQPYIAFIGTSFVLVSGSARPFIKAQMSSLVSESEQGSAFAPLSSTEVLTFMLATVAFLTLYPATIEIFHGFAWAVGACVDIIPVSLILIIIIRDRRRNLPLPEDQEPMVGCNRT